jgi:very-short-patch-repair endonuclease
MRHMGAKVDRVDWKVASVAAAQHGMVSIEQLNEAGLSRNALRRRVEAGRLHRVHRGVYAVGHSGASDRGRWMAAVLACGKPHVLNSGEAAAGPHDVGMTMSILDYWGAALSHRAAACLWELLPPSDGPVDVSICGYSGRARRIGIRLHRSRQLLPASVTLRSGIPVTTPARTISDLRCASSGKTQLISQQEVRRAIRQANVLGLPIEEDDRRDRTRSDLERDFLNLCRRRGLPAPEVNVRVGRHLVDFLWRDRKLIVETDGYAAHRGLAAFEDDRGRDLDLRARGFEVIHLAGKQLDEEPQLVAEVVGAALRVGADGA